MFKKISAALTLAICGVMSGAVAYAHGDHDPDAGKGHKPPPLAVLQLDQTRDVAAKYLDVDARLRRAMSTSACSCPTWAGTT